MRYGCHISIRHGYLGAAKTAFAIGAESFQYFPKNPRSLTVKAFDAKDAQACAEFCRQAELQSIAHSPYPVNLASEPSDLRTATIRSLFNDLQIAEACGSIGVVVHFGKWKGKDALTGYRNVIDTLNEVLREWQGNAQLLIENQAGEGSAFGTTMEELTQIRKLAAHPERIGFCFDTCHAFASGLWTGDNLSGLLEKGDALGYFEHLRAFHLNDSVYPLLSGKDRHAVLGQGQIGETNLRRLVSERRFRELPAVLETPVPKGASHRDQLEWLRGMEK